MADALLGLVAHPLAVVAHVLRETLRALPLPHKQIVIPAQAGIQFFYWIPGLPPDRVGGAPGMTGLRLRVRVHRRAAGELRRDLDHRLVDQHRHRVQVAGESFEPQPLRLQRQRAAAGERVVKSRQPVAVEQLPGARMVGVLGAGAPPARPDLVARRLQDRLVGGVLPQHQGLDDAEQALALDVGQHVVQRRLRSGLRHGEVGALGPAGEFACFFPQLQAGPERGLGLALELGVRAQRVHVGRGVVHHLRKDHGAGRRQGPARPPQVQR